jgi:hypothetical protein
MAIADESLGESDGRKGGLVLVDDHDCNEPGTCQDSDRVTRNFT